MELCAITLAALIGYKIGYAFAGICAAWYAAL